MPAPSTPRRRQASIPPSVTAAWAGMLLALAGCASTTTVTLAPAPQAPVCDATAAALVLWAPQWRPDQKDVAEREAAAADGLARFAATAGCFASASVQRLTGSPQSRAQRAAAEADSRRAKVVLLTLRELGPTVRLGASLALVEGATEVVLDVAEYLPARPLPRAFSVQWRSGGPGVVKGVATLAQDLQAALGAGLQAPVR